jgi:hypothetical protein
VKCLDVEARAELDTLFPGLWSIETLHDTTRLYGLPARDYTLVKDLPDHVKALTATR